jgi:hypothetical protein
LAHIRKITVSLSLSKADFANRLSCFLRQTQE